MFCLFFLIVSFSSCNRPVAPTDIVGSWKGKTLKQALFLSADGLVEIIDREYSTYTGTYTITDKNLLTCHIDHSIFKEPVVRRVPIKGDRLILKAK